MPSGGMDLKFGMEQINERDSEKGNFKWMQ